MMGCFSSSATKVMKQRSSSVPRSGPLRSVVVSKDSLTLLANKPVELPEPGSIVGRLSGLGGEVEQRHLSSPPGVREDLNGPALPGHRKSRMQILKVVEEGRTAFSGPLVGSNARVAKEAGASRLGCGYESGYEEARSCGLRTLRRTTSFGGRPQPLPLPVTEEAEARSPMNATAEQKSVLEDAGRRSRRVKSFTLEEGAGLRSARRGRVAPVGAVPLPPPALAGKWLPSLADEFVPAGGGRLQVWTER